MSIAIIPQYSDKKPSMPSMLPFLPSAALYQMKDNFYKNQNSVDAFIC